MTEPIYLPAFEELWDTHIPEVYRREDAKLGWPMKTFFAGMGQQYAQVSEMIDRFAYVPLNDIPPKDKNTVGVVTTSAHTDLATNPSNVWLDMAQVGTQIAYWQLNANTDGAYAAYYPLLDSGTYDMVFRYLDISTNGIVSIIIDSEIVDTQVLVSTGSGALLSSQAVRFDVTRGYASLKLGWEVSRQAGSHRMNVVDISVTNVKSGRQFSTSDLVDPYAADPAWLPWVAQLFGMVLDQNLSIENQRDSIALGVTGFNAGTKAALAQAAKPYLTQTRTTLVFDHSIVNPGDGGGQFDVLLITRLSETPPGTNLATLLTASGAKPAGVVLHHRSFQASWNAVLTAYPKWAQWQTVPWRTLEESGLD